MADEITRSPLRCPDCEAVKSHVPTPEPLLSRRVFLQTVGAVVLAEAASHLLPAHAQGVHEANLPVPAKPASAARSAPKAETLVKTLYDSLTPKQREVVCLPWDHPRRQMVQANWAIVEPTLADHFNPDQREMVRGILRKLTTEEWYPKILAQMQSDSGGLDTYHAAFFGDPDHGKFEWVLTGRHVTLRANGHSDDNAAFGGPIFYGHAPQFNEAPTHPGNIYWFQAQQANKVFTALDGKQRAIALLDRAPNEDQIALQGAKGAFPGIPIGALSRDQKDLVQTVMRDLLAPYRPSDANEVLRDIKANGGLDDIHLAFYKQDDLGNDGIWDIWRLEGPALVWHFRGAPHVHTWVHVAKKADI